MNNLLDYYDDAIREAQAFENAYVIAIVAVVFAFAAIGLALIISTSLALKKRAEHQKAVNEKILEQMRNCGFVPTRTFFFCDKSTFKKTNEYRQQLFVDSEHNRMGLIDYEGERLKIVDYAQILNYELYENNSLLTSGGGIGGLGIGAFSMETSHICKEMRLIIRLKSADDPQIVYQIVASKGIFNFGIGKNSQIYRLCFPTVQEVVSLLQVILNQSKENT